MTHPIPQILPTTARKIFIWQMLFFAALLALSTVDNIFTTIADHARVGMPLTVWEPVVWECSSHLVTWMLVPLVAWWLALFPITRDSWRLNLPAQLTAAASFSLLHTAGMVLLRKIAYRLMAEQYDFGPFWDNWLYEFRKDLLTYCVIVAGLVAFRTYGLWLDSRSRRQDAAAVVAAPTDQSPPVELPLGRLLVRKRNREFILDAAEIDRIEADGNYVVVHAGAESYRLRESLEGLGKRLGERRFARVHRAHVVNIDRIREIQPWDHGDFRIVLKDGSFVNFSRRYRSRLQHLFQ